MFDIIIGLIAFAAVMAIFFTKLINLMNESRLLNNQGIIITMIIGAIGYLLFMMAFYSMLGNSLSTTVITSAAGTTTVTEENTNYLIFSFCQQLLNIVIILIVVFTFAELLYNSKKVIEPAKFSDRH